MGALRPGAEVPGMKGTSKSGRRRYARICADGVARLTKVHMGEPTNCVSLLMSFQRALLGAVHRELRQASIEADPVGHRITVRYEYDGRPSEEAVQSGSVAATEVIADFSEPWTIHEEHVEAPFPQKLKPARNVAYARAE